MSVSLLQIPSTVPVDRAMLVISPPARSILFATTLPHITVSSSLTAGGSGGRGVYQSAYQPSLCTAFTSALCKLLWSLCQIATLILWLYHPLCTSLHLR